MTTENLISAKETKKIETAVQAELRKLSDEESAIDSAIKQAVQRDADASMEAARNGQSPLAVEKTAPALIARKEELAYLLPVTRERYQEARRDTLRATLQEADAEMKVKQAERAEAEQLALPFISAKDEAQRAERQAATVHGRAQDNLRRLG